MIQPLDPADRRPPAIPGVTAPQPLVRGDREAPREDDRRRERRDGEDRRPDEEPLVDADGHIDVRA